MTNSVTGVVGAIVLAGGASSRMGADKATLEVDGTRLIDRAIAAVAAEAAQRIVVAGPDPGALLPDVVCVEDPGGPRQGPLGGLISGWHQLRASFETDHERIDRVVVLSCDLPLIDPAVITELVHACADGAEAMAHDGERPQPLVAVYHRATIEHLIEEFANGERSIRRAINPESVHLVPVDGDRAVDADTPSDLAAHAVRWPSESEPMSGLSADGSCDG